MDREESSKSTCLYKETCTGSDSEDRVSKHEVREPSIHAKGLSFLTTGVEDYNRIETFSTEELETNVLAW